MSLYRFSLVDKFVYSKLQKLKIPFILAILIAIASTSQTYLILGNFDRKVNLLFLFLVQFFRWQGWVITIPLILFFSKYFRLDTKHWLKWLTVHFPLSIFFSGLHVAFITLVNITFPWSDRLKTISYSQYFSTAIYSYYLEIIIYWAILGAVYAFEYYRKYREQELQASQLQTQLAQANLQALKMQLHPHFLFNTLNTIVSLVRNKENKAAVNMLVGVSDLLRQVLDNDQRQEVTLKEELDFIELYLEIQQIRFSDRLQVDFKINPKTLNALVPNLILQPIVENAIHHGISPKAKGGCLEISAQPKDKMLCLSVFNDGIPLHEALNLTKNHGLGIANTKSRLNQLFGENQSFQIKNTSAGVEVKIYLPLKVALEN